MRRSILFVSVATQVSLLLFCTLSFAQPVLRDVEIIKGNLVRISPRLQDMPEHDVLDIGIKRSKVGANNPIPIKPHPVLNSRALPYGEDPVWQRGSNQANRTTSTGDTILTFPGILNTGVNPSDVNADVGINHIMQASNANNVTSFIRIFNKNGTPVTGNVLIKSITGLDSDGDPVVLFDALANRWFISEMDFSFDRFIIAVSTTPDPLGSYYVYTFATPGGDPDYPKYGIWNNAYVVTANQSTNTVYCLEKEKMLLGLPANSVRFSIPNYPTIGFQAVTPVSLSGGRFPSASDKPMVMRMTDDAWSASIPADRLELFEINLNWASPASSSLSAVLNMPTAAFSTDLCGFTSFSCIPQPGSNVTLDPLREVLMNRIQYRNFGSYRSIVCNHVTDVDAGDRAGVRWYELRNSGSGWGIYQQGTYSPDRVRRWMGAINLNEEGSIIMGYNVSDTGATATFPGLRFTGRAACDAVGSMTLTEKTIVNGTASNISNRYGDYYSMSADPIDNTFWFTGQYNPATTWRTHIGQLKMDPCTPMVPVVRFLHPETVLWEDGKTLPNGECLPYKDIQIPVILIGNPTQPVTLTVSATGSAIQGTNRDYIVSSNVVNLTAVSKLQYVPLRIYNDGSVENVDTITLSYTINNNGGNVTAATYNQQHSIYIFDRDQNEAASNIVSINLFSQNFNDSAAAVSAGWVAIDGGTIGHSWRYKLKQGTPVGNNLDGSRFALCDADAPGNGSTTRDTLISPVMNTASAQIVFLEFDQYYKSLAGDVLNAQVWNGSIWNTVYQRVGADGDIGAWGVPNKQRINITSHKNAALQVRFNYSSNYGWWWAIDNFRLTTNDSSGVESLVNLATADTQYLGPNADVIFYDRVNGKKLARIENLSNNDFGCVGVYIDRAGTGAVNLNGETGNEKKLFSKTIKVDVINPALNIQGPPYRITLYYTTVEKTGWEAQTGLTFGMNVGIIKTAGSISSHIAGNPVVVGLSNAVGSLNSNAVKVSATFNSGFSGFGVRDVSVILPVTILDLVASPGNNKIMLNWLTENEINNKGFVVEKSLNGSTFDSIGFVAALQNSAQRKSYSLPDRNVDYNVTYYYRLKQVDRDSRIAYSRIVAAKLLSDKNAISFFPNPVSKQLSLKITGVNNERVNISIFNMEGKKLVNEEKYFRNEIQTLDVGHLPAGAYTVVCSSKSLQTSFRMIRQ